jgi:DNA-binding response OmpR family regulator
MNSGKLNGYRTPGGHRRILKEELLKFIKENHMEDIIKKKALKKILIVEDDEDAMDLYISILEKENYEIKKSYTGFSSGVAIEFKPDLIILDIMLPDLDGYKICDFIRKSPETANTKIMVISAISDMRKIKKMYELGANEYLIKPFSIVELKNKIKKILY